LRLYLRLTGGGGGLRPGDYKFASPISPMQAIDKIRRGEVFLERVTIPEGYNRFDIAETLAEKTGKATKEEFLRLMDDTSLIQRIAPQARNLEGYLFPDTYNYTTRTTPEELIRAMVNRFNEVFTPEWGARANQENLTVHEAVLNPDQTEDLYVVINSRDGRHKFSRTAAEHDAAVSEYRKLQKEMREEQNH